jgi:hypothetical protein
MSARPSSTKKKAKVAESSDSSELSDVISSSESESSEDESDDGAVPRLFVCQTASSLTHSLCRFWCLRRPSAQEETKGARQERRQRCQEEGCSCETDQQESGAVLELGDGCHGQGTGGQSGKQARGSRVGRSCAQGSQPKRDHYQIFISYARMISRSMSLSAPVAIR